jgi:hypothetical protein
MYMCISARGSYEKTNIILLSTSLHTRYPLLLLTTPGMFLAAYALLDFCDD